MLSAGARPYPLTLPPAGKHVLRVTKMSEARYGAAWLRSVSLGGGAAAFLPAPASPGMATGRRVLFLGDSFTVGWGDMEGKGCAGATAANSNTLAAFGPLVARQKWADAQVLGWSGAGLVTYTKRWERCLRGPHYRQMHGPALLLQALENKPSPRLTPCRARRQVPNRLALRAAGGGGAAHGRPAGARRRAGRGQQGRHGGLAAAGVRGLSPACWARLALGCMRRRSLLPPPHHINRLPVTLLPSVPCLGVPLQVVVMAAGVNDFLTSGVSPSYHVVPGQFGLPALEAWLAGYLDLATQVGPVSVSYVFK